MSNQTRIEKFVTTFLRTMGATTAPGVPQAMLASEPNERGWAAWKAIPSPISSLSVEELQQRIGHKLPSLFTEYLTYKCLLMTDFGLVTLPEIRSDSPLREVDRYAQVYSQNQYLHTNQFFPFGKDSRTGHWVCFELSKMDSEGDCPILDIDAERIGQNKYVPKLRNPSFASLLDEIESLLLSHE